MKRKLLIAFAIVVVTLFVGAWAVGTFLTEPAPQSIGEAPRDLPAEDVQFQSQSGSSIKGWFIQGKQGAGAVVLMHGVRSSRMSMLARARFLSHAGFSVLLFDFQAHGESAGESITFGYLESKDAQAAVQYLRSRAPAERIGVIGVSMGGAATLLASPPLKVDAMVLEEVYSSLEQATTNRLTARLGRGGRIFTPLLTWQFGLRSGVSADALQPIQRVGEITVPKLFLAGAEDRYTTLEESRAIFNAAADPKELWVVEGAGHVDLHAAKKEEYERRVLSFFNATLAASSR